MKSKTFLLKSMISTLLLGVVIMFTNCEKDNEFLIEENSEKTVETQESDITEKAFPDKEEHSKVPNMSGYYKANDGGHYYIRHIGTNVYWFGEHPSGTWANIFKGSLNGNRITGYFYDVPKGRIQGYGQLKLVVNYNSTRITKTFGSNFGGSVWTRTARPSYLPGTRPAGFGVRNDINNLTARWYANDGGYYYVRQVGSRVVWFGERHFTSGRPTWSNVGYGTKIGNNIYLNWADVPKGNINGYGTLQLKMNGANKMTRVSVTGGFGGSVWYR